MKRIQDRLRDLQRQLNASDTGIASASKVLATAQTTVKRLTTRRELLEDVRNEISAGRSVTEGQRQALAKDQAVLGKAQRDLARRLGAELPAAQRRAIDAAVATIDTETSTLRAEVARMKARVAAAERAAARAREAATAQAARYRETQEELRQTPGRISTVQAQIAQLAAASKTAADAGRLGEAYALAGDLDRSLQAARQLADRAREDRLAARLLNEWQKLNDRNEVVATRTAERDERKRELGALEGRLNDRIRGRDAAVKARVVAVKAPAAAPARGRRGGARRRGKRRASR